MMKAWTKSLLSFILVALAAAGGRAEAQTYPSGPVMVFPHSRAGKRARRDLRIVADRLGQVWGQQIVVMNQPGAGGSVAARAAAGSTPDGYRGGLIHVRYDEGRRVQHSSRGAEGFCIGQSDERAADVHHHRAGGGHQNAAGPDRSGEE